MNFRNLSALAFATAILASCSNGSEPANVSGNAVAAPALEDRASEYAAGTAAYSFNVESRSMMIDGSAVDSIEGANFEGYPMLAANVQELSSFDKAVETREQNLELWSGGSLMLAADLHQATPSILWSKSGMQVLIKAKASALAP